MCLGPRRRAQVFNVRSLRSRGLRDFKKTCINRMQIKKTSLAKIYQKLPGWAENA